MCETKINLNLKRKLVFSIKVLNMLMFKYEKCRMGKLFRKFKENTKLFFAGFSHLIFPNLCLSCSCELSRSEEHLCHFCFSQLSFTYFESGQEPSSLDKVFWGRVPIYRAYALLFFEQDKPSQKILHALKYQNKANLGIFMGHIIGKKLKENNLMCDIQALIPVPLHPKKEFLRGYNQSEKIAAGISKEMAIPIVQKSIQKIKHTESQTKKNRFQRWENVASIFSGTTSAIPFQHVAIVDDVVTTGATIEALSKELLANNPELKISIISLAIAK